MTAAVLKFAHNKCLQVYKQTDNIKLHKHTHRKNK